MLSPYYFRWFFIATWCFLMLFDYTFALSEMSIVLRRMMDFCVILGFWLCVVGKYICVGHENIFFLLCNRNEYAVKKFISSPSSSLILNEIFRILLTVRRRYWISWWLKKREKEAFSHSNLDKIEFSLFFMFDCETFFSAARHLQDSHVWIMKILLPLLASCNTIRN